MKLISSIFLLIFFITSYAQAESTLQTESMPQMEPMNTEQENTGFFSISLGGEVIPLDNFKYDATVTNITFGGTISKQSFFEAGVKLVNNGGLLFRYGYGFTEGRQWVPGVDITLLAHAGYSWNKLQDGNLTVGTGFELGPHLKTFISKSFALLIRTGVANYVVFGKDFKNFDLEKFRVYLNLGLQWHF